MSSRNRPKPTILDLPNELKDMICKEFLLEIYENEAEYLESTPKSSGHDTMLKRIDTLTHVPGLTASNILAKSKYHPNPTLFVSEASSGPSMVVRIGHTYTPFHESGPETLAGKLCNPRVGLVSQSLLETVSRLKATLPNDGPLQVIVDSPFSGSDLRSYIRRHFAGITFWSDFSQIKVITIFGIEAKERLLPKKKLMKFLRHGLRFICQYRKIHSLEPPNWEKIEYEMRCDGQSQKVTFRMGKVSRCAWIADDTDQDSFYMSLGVAWDRFWKSVQLLGS